LSAKDQDVEQLSARDIGQRDGIVAQVVDRPLLVGAIVAFATMASRSFLKLPGGDQRSSKQRLCLDEV
jgi:hypothetical protein